MKIISSKEVYSTPIFKVTEDHAVAPDGFEIKRAIVRHGGSAVIVAVDDKGRILMVRQYRLPAHDYLWNCPRAGWTKGNSARNGSSGAHGGDRSARPRVEGIGLVLPFPRVCVGEDDPLSRDGDRGRQSHSDG